ncbi:MAG: InlB B-repeat-containing protein [Eubacteriales bacterium]|nr:InlB B-repeat-containing protein [Eubacteriales bacterium]
MLRNACKRCLTMLLAVLMVIAMLPATAKSVQAATALNGLSVNGLTAETSGGEWEAGGTSINGSAKGSSGGCSSSAGNGSITLKNTLSTEAVLTFEYELTLNGGTVQIDGNAVTANGTFSKKISSADTVDIAIKTQAGNYTTGVIITNISLIVERNATTTFVPAENGVYTVDGQKVEAATSSTQVSTKAYALSASASAGYKFLGWYSETTGEYFSNSEAVNKNFDTDQTITAIFVPQDAPLFETAGSRFADLNEAVRFAQGKNANKITLVSDGILPAGTYTVPGGITLLIPFDDAGTTYTTAPANVSTSYVKPSAFRTLTMAAGAELVVNGAVSISAKHAAAPGSGKYGGSPSGKVGWINMDTDSAITVNNGGALYAWGFVTGSGNVTINSGAKVYENFQITDFRGGNETSKLASGPIFPFSQYYIQNVEVPMTIMSGGTETVYSSLYAVGSAYSTSIEFIGNNGMFKLGEGSTFTKRYDRAADRQIFDLYGDAELKNLTVTVAVATVNSANFNLPINSNITLNVHEGTTTVNQSIALQPGVEATIDSGATLKIADGKKVYIYDADQWGNYTMSAKLISLLYPSDKEGVYTRGDADIKDVIVDVNGTIDAVGSAYTTESGADITSSEGTGKVVFTNNAGTDTTTEQYENNSTKVSIPITSAKLHNADGSYTETADAAAGDEYTYVNGTWTKNASEAETINITFDANGGEGTMEELNAASGEETALTENAFSRDGYEFNGWNTAADGTGTAYADGAAAAFSEDTTLYAQWKELTFTVTWIDEDGTELEKDENVAYGTTPTYEGDTPTKASTEQYSYTFSGWTPEVTKVTADVTYKAVYTAVVNEYTITWKNEDGTELAVQKIAYGETPVYAGETPVKEADEQFTYAFSGWTPEVTAVSGDAVYTAVFTETTNAYTVIWNNWDGTELGRDTVEYGGTPAYTGETPVKAADAQYTYTFSGWDPELNAVTGEVSYTAQFDQTVNMYTVTWKCEGEVLKTEQTAYGETPVYAGETPVKTADEQHTYTFEGWTPEAAAVTGDIEYTAVFKEEVRTYSVIWKNEDGTVLKTDEDAAYGTKITYDGETPAKAEDDSYTYTFAGWTPELTEETTVTGDMTFTAVYTAEKKAFTVIWQNWNNDLLEKDENVEVGTVPTYDGSAPVRENKEWYTYNFTGWTPEVSAVTGDITYTAEYMETGLNGWQENEKGRTYVENGEQKYFDAWAEIDGSSYFFDAEGYVVKGMAAVEAQDGSGTASFVFDETTGAFRSELTGIYENGEDTYYVINGRVQESAGLVRIVKEDGAVNYYYFAEDSKAVKNYPEGGSDYWVEKTNGLLPMWGYHFDGNGVITHEDDTSLQGVHANDLGIKYYYIDGVKVHIGMFRDENGSYYYAKGSGQLVVNQKYYCTKVNDTGLKEGSYAFDEEGRLILPDAAKNGIVAENGSLYYYVDGKLTYAGLIEIDGDYYYVKTSGEVVHGQNYWITKTNDLLKAGSYAFADDGKIQIKVVKNGIVAENDSLFYYVNDKLTYAGLIDIDGDYYYAKTSGEVVHGRSYWITKTNGLVKEGSYSFDDNGKMQNPPTKTEDTTKNGIVAENGSLYYYVDGVVTYAGLIDIDGSYYYVKTSGEVIHGKKYWITKTNGLVKEGSYTFDDTGKMVR